MNTTALIVAAVLVVTLLVFLIMRNKKDRKDFEKQENLDYKKPRDHEGDTRIEDPKD